MRCEPPPIFVLRLAVLLRLYIWDKVNYYRQRRQGEPSMAFWSRIIAAQVSTPPDDEDDAALVAAARAHPPAFTYLYRRYFAPIYRYCYLRLGDHAAAEDACSEVFLKAVANFATYRDGEFAAWLFRIARNTVIDMQRRQRPTAPVEAIDTLADPAPGPEDDAIQRASHDELRAALALLSEEQRTVLELQLASWRSEQIGAALGRSAGTVRMIRFRAFARLREMLPHPSLEVSDE